MIRKPTHPGNVFLEDVMKPLNLTVTDAARMLGVSRKALSAESWMNMQQKLTLWIAHQHEPANVIPFPLSEVKEG